jgi:hypothetical protein
MMKCFMHSARASFIFLMWMFAALSTKFVHVQQQKQKKKIKRSRAEMENRNLYVPAWCAAAADGLVIVPREYYV